MNESLLRNAMALLAVVFTALVAATFVAPQLALPATVVTLLYAITAIVVGYAAFGDRNPTRA
jgi:hypothetical protein